VEVKEEIVLTILEVMKGLIVLIAKQALFNLDVKSAMWSFHDNGLSMVKPRNVVLFKLEIMELEDTI
jgi:hypothetical protein